MARASEVEGVYMSAVESTPPSGLNYTIYAKTSFMQEVPCEIAYKILSIVPDLDSLGKSLGCLARTCKIFKEHIDKNGARNEISSLFLSENKIQFTSKDLECLKKIVRNENAEIEALKQVRHLDLSNSKIDNEQLQTILNHCENLETLNLHGCWRITDLKLTKQRKLKELKLSGCRGLKAFDLSNQLMLERLELSGCMGLTELDLFNLANLRGLNLHGCFCLITLILSDRASLQELNLQGCFRLIALNLSNHPNLQEPTLTGCNAEITLPEHLRR